MTKEYTIKHPDSGAVLHFDDQDSAVNRAQELADFWDCDISVLADGEPVWTAFPPERLSLASRIDLIGEL